MKMVTAVSDKMKERYAFQLVGFFAYPCLSELDLTFKPQDGHTVSLAEKSVKHSGHLRTFISFCFVVYLSLDESVCLETVLKPLRIHLIRVALRIHLIRVVTKDSIKR